MRIFSKLFLLNGVFALLACSACHLTNGDSSPEREPPSSVVKKFWRLAQENDFESARLLVSKDSLGLETGDKRHDEFYTPEFIKMLHNTDNRMQSICECGVDAVLYTKVLLKIEEKEGNTKVFKFLLSEQNDKKIWKIVWVSEAELNDSACD